MPAFVEGIHVPKAALPEAVAPGLDARVVNAGKVAEQAFTSDGSHP
ncbi:BnaC09g13160D [Brassica napus]|uniref:BnaC09g13160D protein n=2 Tax=Brassica napus TaxID=3708 RepID=A0A078H4Q6_BRANA|nr:BnaC09g13160D [Brassica napus]